MQQSIKTNTFNTGEILKFEEFTPYSELEFEELIKELKIKIWDRVDFAKSMIGESEFNRRMQHNTKLSKSSDKYSRVVRKVSNDLVKMNLAYSSLENY